MIHCSGKKIEIVTHLEKIRIHARPRLNKHANAIKITADQGIGAQCCAQMDSAELRTAGREQRLQQGYDRFSKIVMIDGNLLLCNNCITLEQNAICVGASDINSDNHIPPRSRLQADPFTGGTARRYKYRD
jgi:hypothetical protein